MRPRNVKVLWGTCVLAAVIVACETTRNPGGIQPDRTEPVITLSPKSVPPDTQQISGGLRFTVNAVDNLSLKTIELFYTGGHIGQEDTLFTSAQPTFQLSKTLTFPPTSGSGGLVRIVARATDGAANTASDEMFIFLSNVDALNVTLLAPAPNAVASRGRGIPVDVTALQNEGIRKIGFVVTPAGAAFNGTTPPADSQTFFTLPYADSVRYVDTLTVLANGGTFTIQGFAEDSSGRRGTSAVVTVTVESPANDTTPPVVNHIISSRVEVDDSVLVHATDGGGISWIGLRVQRASDELVLVFDSVNVSGGNLTDVSRNFSLGLAGLIPQDQTPFSIIVRGWACDLAAARNCAFSQTSTVIQATPSAGGAVLSPGAEKPGFKGETR